MYGPLESPIIGQKERNYDVLGSKLDVSGAPYATIWRRRGPFWSVRAAGLTETRDRQAGGQVPAAEVAIIGPKVQKSPVLGRFRRFDRFARAVIGKAAAHSGPHGLRARLEYLMVIFLSVCGPRNSE